MQNKNGIFDEILLTILTNLTKFVYLWKFCQTWQIWRTFTKPVDLIIWVNRLDWNSRAPKSCQICRKWQIWYKWQIWWNFAKLVDKIICVKRDDPNRRALKSWPIRQKRTFSQFDEILSDLPIFLLHAFQDIHESKSKSMYEWGKKISGTKGCEADSQEPGQNDCFTIKFCSLVFSTGCFTSCSHKILAMFMHIYQWVRTAHQQQPQLQHLCLNAQSHGRVPVLWFIQGCAAVRWTLRRYGEVVVRMMVLMMSVWHWNQSQILKTRRSIRILWGCHSYTAKR